MQDAVTQPQQQMESPLSFVLEYSTAENPFLQQAALLYAATTERITLPIAHSANAPTAYLGTFVTVTEELLQCGNAEGNKPEVKHKIGALSFLLAKILPKVNAVVISSVYQRLAALFITTLKRYADIEYIAKQLLQCLSLLLRMLDLSTIETNDSCREMVKALLIFTIDKRPKIRKPAQQAFERVYRALSTNTSNYAVPAVFQQVLVKFCQMEFEVNDMTKKDCTPALYLCGLLKLVLYTCSTRNISAILAALLQLTAQGNPFLLLQTFLVLASLYTKGFEFSTCLVLLQQHQMAKQTTPEFLKDFESKLKLSPQEQKAMIDKDVEFTFQLLLNVIDLKPNMNDVAANKAFNATLVAMYKMLFSFNNDRAMSKLVDILITLKDTLMSSNKNDILNNVYLTIQHLLTVTLNKRRFAQDLIQFDKQPAVALTTSQDMPKPTTQSLLLYVRQLFLIPSLESKQLHAIFNIIISTMSMAEEQDFVFFKDLLVIVETYHAKAQHNNEIQTACERVIAHGIRHFTPEKINTILPINFPTATNTDLTIVQQLHHTRIWLLQLYPSNVRNSTLQYFHQQLLPQANHCYQLSLTAKQQNRPEEAHYLQDITTFVWESFPAFCLLPKDVETQFKNVMKDLVQYYNSDQFAAIAQQPICRGIRNICSKNLSVINDNWGMEDDLGLNAKHLDFNDLLLLHTVEQYQQFMKYKQNKGKISQGDVSDNEDDEEEDDNDNEEEQDDNDNDEPLDLFKMNQKTLQITTKTKNVLYNQKQRVKLTPPITKEQAEKNIAVIGPLGKILLPLFFNTVVNIFTKSLHLTEENSNFIPLLLDTILAYTCAAPNTIRDALFKTAFQQFLAVTQEITKIYNAIEDFEEGDNDNNNDDDEMPSLDMSNKTRQNKPSLEQVEEPTAKCRALSDILVAMSPALSLDCLTLFLQSIILNFNSPSEILQKKAYQVVQQLITTNAQIFQHHWKNVLITISTSSANTQPAAMKQRLLLCRALYSHILDPLDHKEVISTLPALLSEVILATKETNAKVRNAAYELMVAIGVNIYNSGLSPQQLDIYKQQQQNNNIDDTAKNKNIIGKNFLAQYLTMVLAGLAASTPRMISATVNALARLVFEFKQILAPSIVKELFSTIIIMLPTKSREILKASLDFLKVSIVALPVETLRPYVREMLYAFSDWRDGEKSRFKRKVRIIYQLLMKRYGLDFMRQTTPPDDKRLIEYLRKQQVRAQNQKEREQKEQRELQRGQKIIDAVFGSNNNNKAQNKKDDDDDVQDLAAKYHSGMSFEEIVGMDNDHDDDDDMDDGADFSAAGLLQKSLNKQAKNNAKKAKLDDDDFVSLADSTNFLDTDLASKLKANLKKSKTTNSMTDDADGGVDMNDMSTTSGAKKRKSNTLESDNGKLDFTGLEKKIMNEEREEKIANRKPSESEIKNQRKKQKLLVKQRREEKRDWHEEKIKKTIGKNFASTRGAGDVKRKDMKYDPYAYVPLDPRTLNTKKLTLRQQSQVFASMLTTKGQEDNTAARRGPGQQLSRAQRRAIKDKGGRYGGSQFKE